MSNPYANIYSYVDFRQYLADYQKARYDEDKSFSRNGICRKLGLPNTKSYFKDVLYGKTVTKSFIERFIAAFEMDNNEAEFFRVLVQFNQSTEEQERNLFFDQLIALNRAPKKIISKETFDYYSEWYHSAIRALLDIHDFSDDYKWLSKKIYPNLTPAKVKGSIQLLSKLELIQKNEDGFWKPVEKLISTGSYAQSELLKQYQLTNMELAKHALLNEPDDFHNLSTITISASKDVLGKMEKKLKKFKSEILSMAHKDTKKAEYGYQLNIQLFPFSKR